MRIYLKTTPNTEPVPYNYQAALVGALHKWIGWNEVHDSLSLYSLSWLSGNGKSKNGLHFSYGAKFFISSPDETFLKKLISGVRDSPNIQYGMSVVEINLQDTPKFTRQERFFMQSPILIKRNIEQQTKFFFPHDKESDKLMTETLCNKLRKIGMGNLDIKISFDQSYYNIRTKLVNYKGIENKATFCPIIIEGDPEAVALAWEVGIGNSTGIGFGAIK